jgi:hypothetical protein
LDVNVVGRSENLEPITELGQKPMKRSEDGLQRKGMNRCDVVVLVLSRETRLPETNIDFISAGIRMGNTSHTPGRIANRLYAEQEFRDDRSRFPAAGAGNEAYVPLRYDSVALLIR